MTEINTTHRPLIGGIQIVSARLEGSTPDPISSGTLTALATRKSDQQKVLVTCLHVMSDGGLSLVHQPLEDDEEMYQGGSESSYGRTAENQLRSIKG